MKTNAKNLTTRLVAMLIAVVMIISLIPIIALADEPDTTEYVYLSISFDGQYIDDKDGNAIVYMPVSLDEIAAIDLAEYGLENMLFDADGDGEYETTALQLLIYAHETIYGGNWSDVTFDALPGSSYFKGGIFGFTENLMYFHNGTFPVDESQSSDWYTVGATSDRIVLKAGDYLDVASFGCWAFLWDILGGFHFFADENEIYNHTFTAEAGDELSIKLMHSFCDLMSGEAYAYGAADYPVYYGKTYGVADGELTTDGDGNVTVSFDEAGEYFVWCYGACGSDDGTHISCDYYNETGEPCIVSAPGFAKITVGGGATPEPEPAPVVPQDVSAVLNATMAQLATTVSAPVFGTGAGEWTVFALARGEYFEANDDYFSDYYNRIVETVNQTAAQVDLNGALDKNKSTENSRLIVALSAIGKDARAVGDWNLVEAYSLNGINWIKKQGINGTIWTLIALDSGNYETSDTTIRQQCVDSILSLQHNDNGWSLVTAKDRASNVDITCMALTALYPYRDQPEVASACEKAIEWLSSAQLESGGFPYGNGETSESCAWAIVALTTWGINPDTDPRFIKNENSCVDNLLSYYVEEDRMFAHAGTESNAMATDQATYALVAYQRFINEKTALYDYSDVEFEDYTPAQHSYSPTVTPPTCTKDGYTTYNCSTCPHSYVDDTVSASGHTAGEWIIDKEAEIGVAGSKHKECTSCGETLETEEIDALEDDTTNDSNGESTNDSNNENTNSSNGENTNDSNGENTNDSNNENTNSSNGENTTNTPDVNDGADDNNATNAQNNEAGAIGWIVGGCVAAVVIFGATVGVLLFKRNKKRAGNNDSK